MGESELQGKKKYLLKLSYLKHDQSRNVSASFISLGGHLSLACWLMIFFSWLDDKARSVQLMFNHTLLPSERFVDTLTSKKTKQQISSKQWWSALSCQIKIKEK